MRHYINLVELLLEDFDTDSFLNRVRSVMALVRRGGTPGERDAAKHAFDRMIARATFNKGYDWIEPDTAEWVMRALKVEFARIGE